MGMDGEKYLQHMIQNGVCNSEEITVKRLNGYSYGSLLAQLQMTLLV